MSKQKESLREAFWPKVKTERERRIASDRWFAGFLLGSVVMGGMVGYKASQEMPKLRLKDEAPAIKRIVDVDAETFDELDIEKGSIVYNDTEDTYMVYVDDTEVSPAQEPGWYEIDMNNPVVTDQQTQSE